MKTDLLRKYLLQLGHTREAGAAADIGRDSAGPCGQHTRAKAVLVSEKKLKKDPKESYIYRDEEGHFMERIGKQEPVCIDNDLPFVVPEGGLRQGWEK